MSVGFGKMWQNAGFDGENELAQSGTSFATAYVSAFASRFVSWFESQPQSASKGLQLSPSEIYAAMLFFSDSERSQTRIFQTNISFRFILNSEKC